MHMHSIPFIKLLLCRFVQTPDLMYLLSVHLSSVQVFLLTTTLGLGGEEGWGGEGWDGEEGGLSELGITLCVMGVN